MSGTNDDNLADVARKRHRARQPIEQEGGGVNALLGKLRYIRPVFGVISLLIRRVQDRARTTAAERGCSYGKDVYQE